MNKFKPGDHVIIYGLVKAKIVSPCYGNSYVIVYDKKIGQSPGRGEHSEESMELVEIFESPLYKTMNENE